MNPSDFLARRKRHELIRRAKELVKDHNSNSVADIEKQILFKQEAGMLPEDYLKKEADKK